MKFAVEPVSADVRVPPHPIEGPMPAEGAEWIADQHTLRLIVDGVIRRKDGDTDETALARMRPRQADASDAVPAVTDADAQQGRRRTPSARADAAPSAPASQES